METKSKVMKRKIKNENNLIVERKLRISRREITRLVDENELLQSEIKKLKEMEQGYKKEILEMCNDRDSLKETIDDMEEQTNDMKRKIDGIDDEIYWFQEKLLWVEEESELLDQIKNFLYEMRNSLSNL
tara:strand:- start:260 stop:646 length:387 start_codon:yes stop_codon:yes gene_type:complete